MRAFLAIELSDAVRGQVAAVQAALRADIDADTAPRRNVRVSWTSPATMHLTVKFLGDVDDAVAEPLRQALAPALQAIAPFSVPLDRLGAFPDARDARVLWLGPSDQWSRSSAAAGLAALHELVEDACARIGVAQDDRPLTPHLTLCRVRDGGRELGRILACSSVFTSAPRADPLAVNALVLVKSVLGPGGATHTRLWSLPTTPGVLFGLLPAKRTPGVI